MLGDNLRNLRHEKKLTQQEVANFLKVKRVTYTQYELNKREPDNETLQRLATFFSVTPNDLLSVTPPPKEEKKPKDLEKFLDNQEIMFDGVPLTEDDKAKIRKSLEIIFWDAREKNKKARAEAKAKREKETNDRS